MSKTTKRIEDRIKELEFEIQGHQQKLSQFQLASNELQTAIVSRNGALIELRKLLKE